MLLLISAAVLLFTGTDGFTSENANNYLDTMFRTAFQQEVLLNRLDPLKLEDLEIIVKANGTASSVHINFNEGSLTDFKLTHRSGNCSTPMWYSANVTFACNITFDFVLFYYDVNVTYGEINNPFQMQGHTNETMMSLLITSTPHRNVPSLQHMYISREPRVEIQLPMVYVLGGDIDLALQVREPIFRVITWYFRTLLTGRFRQVLENSINSTPFPFA